MITDAIVRAGWKELIASVDVIGETFRQQVNQQLQEAQQQNRKHLARVSEILARPFRDEFRHLSRAAAGTRGYRT
jgi:hypothetical protein